MKENIDTMVSLDNQKNIGGSPEPMILDDPVEHLIFTKPQVMNASQNSPSKMFGHRKSVNTKPRR